MDKGLVSCGDLFYQNLSLDVDTFHQYYLTMFKKKHI